MWIEYQRIEDQKMQSPKANGGGSTVHSPTVLKKASSH